MVVLPYGGVVDVVVADALETLFRSVIEVGRLVWPVVDKTPKVDIFHGRHVCGHPVG